MLRINRSDCYVYSPQNLQRIAMMAGIVANRSFHRVSSLNRFCSSCSRTVAYVLIPTWFWGLTVQTAAPRPGYGRHFPHWPTQSVFAAYHGYKQSCCSTRKCACWRFFFRIAVFSIIPHPTALQKRPFSVAAFQVPHSQCFVPAP